MQELWKQQICFTLKLNNLGSKKLPVWIRRWQTDLCNWCCISDASIKLHVSSWYLLQTELEQTSEILSITITVSPTETFLRRCRVWPSESAHKNQSAATWQPVSGNKKSSFIANVALILRLLFIPQMKRAVIYTRIAGVKKIPECTFLTFRFKYFLG